MGAMSTSFRMVVVGAETSPVEVSLRRWARGLRHFMKHDRGRLI